MPFRSLHHVSVWVDDLSLDEGAFSQAMFWAGRLGLPLRAVTKSAAQAFQDLNQDRPSNECFPVVREPAPNLEKIKNWGTACAQRGIPMETTFWTGDLENGLRQFIKPFSLCVFEDYRTDSVRQKLLAQSLRSPDNILLLTPPIPKAMTRVLVLNYQHNSNSLFVETAARLCQTLHVHPLILTMATTEQEACLKQSFAQGVCSSLHLQADFDSLVAYNLPSAVDRVAGWRHCSHIIFERTRNILGISLWQRLRSDIFSELRYLSDSLTLLALPPDLTLDIANLTCDNPLIRNNDLEPMHSKG